MRIFAIVLQCVGCAFRGWCSCTASQKVNKIKALRLLNRIMKNRCGIPLIFDCSPTVFLFSFDRFLIVFPADSERLWRQFILKCSIFSCSYANSFYTWAEWVGVHRKMMNIANKVRFRSKMTDFILKIMGSILKTVDFIPTMMRFILKMMDEYLQQG